MPSREKVRQHRNLDLAPDEAALPPSPLLVQRTPAGNPSACKIRTLAPPRHS
jgi:hypothetical protein